MEELFLTPLADVPARAVKVAREAEAGELGDAAGAAYTEQIEKNLEATGLTIEQLDQLGAPRTWLGRMAERVQDWWWEKTAPQGADQVDEGLEAALSFPVPLLQTHPLQDVPFEYDDVDQKMQGAVEDIAAAISGETAWTRLPFSRSEPDDDEFDPLDVICAVWALPQDGALLLLISGPDEDPKLMGYSLGIVHLVDTLADALRNRLG